MSFAFKTAQQALNITDFFQVGDPDYTAAINRAIVEANTHKIDVFIPPGTWDVSEQFSDTFPACIRFDGVSGFRMFGVPGASVIRQRGASLGGGSRLSIVQFHDTCNDIELSDFVVNGNSANVTDPPTSEYIGVDIASGIDTIINGVIVHDLATIAGGGNNQGIRIGKAQAGSLFGDNARITVRNCVVFDCEIGFELHEQCDEFAEFIDCMAFDCSFSPFDLGAQTNPIPFVLVDGCLGVRGAAFYSFRSRPKTTSPPIPVKQIVIRNSSFLGLFELEGHEEAIITNNAFLTDPTDTGSASVINAVGLVESTLIADNLIVGEDFFAIRVSAGLNTQNKDMFVTNNIIFAQTPLSATVNAIRNITFSSNVCVHFGSGLGDAFSYQHSGPQNVEGGDISILDNYFEGDFRDIDIRPSASDPAGTIGQVRVVGNEFRLTTSTILSIPGRLLSGGARFREIPIVTRNNARANPPSLNQEFIQILTIDQLEYRAYVSGGNPGGPRGGIAYTASDSPLVTGLPGNQGDRCNDLQVNASTGGINPLVVEPFDLEPGDTLDVSVDGGGTQTATFTAAAGSVTSNNAETYALSDGETLDVQVDGGGTQTATFNTGDFSDIANATAAEVAAVITADIAGATAADVGGSVVITSDVRGSSSSIQVTGGTANTALDFPLTLQSGSGNVANIDAVTVAEHASVVNAAVTGVTAAGANQPFAGSVSIRSNTGVPGASIQVLASSTADAAFGYDNLVHVQGGLWVYEGGAWVKK